MSDTVKPRSPHTSETVWQRIVAIRAPRLLRGLELALVCFALAVGVSAVLIVDLTVHGHFTDELLQPGLLFTLAVFMLHVALRLRAPDADPLLLPIAVLLNAVGIAQIYRIDLAEHDSGWAAASVRQLVWSTIAILAATAVLVVIRNHLKLYRYTFLSGLGALVLLLLPILPGLGTEINGARVWIGIGAFSFQPGEVAKILLAIFFAGYLVRNAATLSAVSKKILGLRLPRARDLGPLLLCWIAALAVLIFQRDLGTSLLYFGLFVSMLYLATGRLSWIVLGLSLFFAGGWAVSRTLTSLGFTYVNVRFTNWLDPFADPLGGGYQMLQGLFGMANGGMTGTGLGQGFPNETPEARSDYIFASLGEELGLVGVFVILACYLMIIARALRIGFAGQDDFGKLLAAGLAFSIAFQVFIVIGGVTRVIPLTGLTLPFLAAGGSSLLSNWIILALLCRMSSSIRNRPRLVVHP